MKKIIGAALILVLVILLAGPFVAGMKAERELQNAIEKFNAYPGYELAWTEYQRGWFSTEAVLSVGFDMSQWPNDDADPIVFPTLPLNIQISHGPILLTKQQEAVQGADEGQSSGGLNLGWYSWRLDLSPDQTAWLQERLNSDSEGDLYDAWGHMGLTGSVAFNDKLQAFSIDDEAGNRFITVNGYAGSGAVSSAGELSYQGHFEGMDVAAQDALLVLGNTTLEFSGDLSRIDWNTFLYPSDFSMTLESLRIQGNEGEMLMTNTHFSGAVEMPTDENWFTLTANMGVEQVIAGDVRIDNAVMDLAYERISTRAYQAYIDMVKAMSESATAQQDMDYQSFFTPEIMQEFFANGPAFVLRDLSFSMPEGSFDGDFELAIQKDLVEPVPVINPLMLIQAITLAANVEIDQTLALYFSKEASRARMQATMNEEDVEPEDAEAALIEEAQATVDMLLAQNILVKDGEDLKATMQFIDGQLLLNGNPIPLPLGALMGAQ